MASEQSKPPYYIEIRKQTNGEFYWVQCDTNNKQIVARGESHPTYQNAERAWRVIAARMHSWAYSTALAGNESQPPYEIRDMRDTAADREMDSI